MIEPFASLLLNYVLTPVVSSVSAFFSISTSASLDLIGLGIGVCVGIWIRQISK